MKQNDSTVSDEQTQKLNQKKNDSNKKKKERGILWKKNRHACVTVFEDPPEFKARINLFSGREKEREREREPHRPSPD